MEGSGNVLGFSRLGSRHAAGPWTLGFYQTQPRCPRIGKETAVPSYLAKAGVLEILDEIAENAEEGDIEAIKKTVQDLKDLVRGHGDPPAFH